MSILRKEKLLEDERVAAFDKMFVATWDVDRDTSVITNPKRTIVMVLKESESQLAQECQTKENAKVTTIINDSILQKDAVWISDAKKRKHLFFSKDIIECLKLCNNKVLSQRIGEIVVEDKDTGEEITVYPLILEAVDFWLMITDTDEELFFDQEWGHTQQDVIDPTKTQRIIRGSGFKV